MTKTSYRNRRLETLHKTATALHRVGALDNATMRDLDAFCLTKVESLPARTSGRCARASA
jgi:putative transcriptional regulator